MWAPLAAGEKPGGMEEALAMTDALRKELPRMLEEHKRIHSATEKLRSVACEEKASVHEQFADDLALHAWSAEADGQLTERLMPYTKPKLLIIDELSAPPSACR